MKQFIQFWYVSYTYELENFLNSIGIFTTTCLESVYREKIGKKLNSYLFQIVTDFVMKYYNIYIELNILIFYFIGKNA